MKNRLLYIILISFSLYGCVRVETPQVNGSGSTVTVPISFHIAGEDGTRATVMDPDQITSPEDVIKNLWVIQFNGTSDDSRVLGAPVYIKDFSNFDGNLSLVPTDGPTTIVFIANTFEVPGVFNVSSTSTLKDIKQLKRKVTKETDILGIEKRDENGELVCHVLFNGIVSLDRLTDDSAALDVALKRNVAKLNITLTLGDEAISKGLVLKGAQIASVPSVSYYLTNTALESPFPAIMDFSKVNYQEILLDTGENARTITTYVPVNMRGKGPDGTDPKDKNISVPDGATYLLVNGEYGDQGQYSVIYTFYLGENMSDDFNLKPNFSYNYNFAINDIGNVEEDSRVENWGLVDFTDTEAYPLSNCYILNPIPGTGDDWRDFRIPVDRANIFWGDYESSTYSLAGKEWYSFVLASDFTITDDNFRIEKEVHPNGSTSFLVSVKQGVSGNVIVAAGTSKNTVSWSWHLWITDYNPNGAHKLGDGIANKYIYSEHISNGTVHRYKGIYWDNHSSVYIMDRNLGALSTGYPQDARSGFLYYQFGRKDPFFVDKDKYLYPEDNYEVSKSVAYDEANASNGVAYSVLHPLWFIESQNNNWTSGNKYNPSVYSSDIIWNDPEAKTNGTKSIFDPCPPGFRLPPQEENGPFSDFGYNNGTIKSTNVTNLTSESSADVPLVRGFDFLADVKGLQYWPDDENDIPSEIIFFPATGYLNPSDANNTRENIVVSNIGSWVNMWLETPYTNNQGYRFFGRKGNLGSDDDNSTAKTLRARAFPVRCITDNR